MLNNFIYAQTKELFLNALENHQILDEAIVFIEDTKEIWNHGHYFDCSTVDLSDYATKEEAEEIKWVDLDTFAFKIDGVTYYAKLDMTWKEWVGSKYDPGKIVRLIPGGYAGEFVKPYSDIWKGDEYIDAFSMINENTHYMTQTYYNNHYNEGQ